MTTSGKDQPGSAAETMVGPAQRPSDRDETPLTTSPKRRKLLDAALLLFEANGFASTTVQDIVRAADVTKGSFYHWFASKDDVLRLLHDEFVDGQLEMFESILAADLSNAEKLGRLLEATMERVEHHRAGITVYLRENRFLSEESMRAVKVKRDKLEEIVVTVINDGMTNGEFRRMESPRLLAFGILGMCGWAIQWFQPGGPMTGREVAAMWNDVLDLGLVITP